MCFFYSQKGGANIDLIVFIATGVTHRFHKVKNLQEKDGKLTFDYIGLSTGQELLVLPIIQAIHIVKKRKGYDSNLPHNEHKL